MIFHCDLDLQDSKPIFMEHNLAHSDSEGSPGQTFINILKFYFNIFLERIMTDALVDHEGTVSTGGRTITNLRFADDIDVLAGEEEELANLVERLDKASRAYGMVIS